MSGYEQVVCTNRMADSFQACSYRTMHGVDRRFD
jgi:hypothetical protein